MFEIRLLPIAEQEMDEAEAWYRLESVKLGNDFHNQVDEQIARIASNPFLYAVIKRDIRRAPVRRFPHGIFFRVSGNVVFVVGVFHPSRQPSLLHDR